MQSYLIYYEPLVQIYKDCYVKQNEIWLEWGKVDHFLFQILSESREIEKWVGDCSPLLIHSEVPEMARAQRAKSRS